jgi:putative GTP pyrophosphokinase
MALSPEEVDRAVAEYERLRPLYKRFGSRLADLLSTLVEELGVKLQSAEHRAKTVQGFREKITRPGKAYTEPLKQVTDLTGVRLVLFYDEDVKTVTEMLRTELLIDDTLSIDKTQSSEPDRFGYASVHLVAELREHRKTLKEWARVADLRAEIQVRTVLQHAWAAVSHELNYKKEEAPIAWSRRLHRLAGMFELADEQFSLLRKERKDTQARVTAALAEGDLAMRIDELSLREYLRGSDHVKAAWNAARHHMFIYQQRSEPEDFTTELAQLAERASIKTIGELDDLITEQLPRAEALFTRLTENDTHHWWANEAFVISLLLLLGRNEHFSREDLIAAEWMPDVVGKVLEAVRAVAAG